MSGDIAAGEPLRSERKSVLGNSESEGGYVAVIMTDSDGDGDTAVSQDRERRLARKTDGFVAEERTSRMCLRLLKRNLLKETIFRKTHTHKKNEK